MEEKMTTSATNELGKHPSKKDYNGVVGETNNETDKLVVGLWKTSHNWGKNSATTETNNIIDNTNEMKNFFHQDNREITWTIDNHHNSNIP